MKKPCKCCLGMAVAAELSRCLTWTLKVMGIGVIFTQIGEKSKQQTYF